MARKICIALALLFLCGCEIGASTPFPTCDSGEVRCGSACCPD